MYTVLLNLSDFPLKPHFFSGAAFNMGITSMTRKAWTRCLPADNYPTHSALHYISGTFLPEDIWFYFSKYYLKHTDIVNLSSTCHYIRECLLPLLFARMSLVGGTIDYNPDPSLRRAITRIQHLRYYLRWLRSNLRILKHVRSVHVTNWLPLLVTPWSLHGRFTVHVSGNARRSLSGLWKSAFQELADFIASIPSLESITFCEGFVQAYGGSSPFNIPHTWTRDTVSLLEFEIIHGRNPSELFKFCQTEETLFQPANRLGIEIDYFLSLLRYNDFRVISAILPGHLVLHIPQPLLGRLHTLRKLRLGLSLQKEFPIEMKNLVEDILSSICPLLRSVDISLDRQNLQPLHLRPDMLPPVEELIAPPPIIQQLMSTGTYARVSTLRVRETRWVAMAAMFSSSHYPVMDSVTTLDLSSLSSINRLLLDDIAKVCSRLETLVLGAPQGSTSIHRDHAVWYLLNSY